MCARCLGVPPEAVFISETSTDTVPNSIPTAASMSTDLYGMAVKVSALVLVGLGPSIIAESASSKLHPHGHYGFRPRVHYF